MVPMTEKQPESSGLLMILVSVTIRRTDCQTPTVIFFQRRNTVTSQEFVIFSDYLQADNFFFFFFFFDASFQIVLGRWTDCYTEGLEEKHAMLIDLSYLLASAKNIIGLYRFPNTPNICLLNSNFVFDLI